MGTRAWIGVATCLSATALSRSAYAHGIPEGDTLFLLANEGPAIAGYAYLGAKHMITGIDHLLFLAGVIFFLYRLKDVALYVTLFALGHSATLLIGVLGDVHLNPWLVDAIIGLSVAYKAFENMGGFKTVGVQPDSRVAVAVFGLCHGFGLATKLESVMLSPDGLVVNILSFNLGVELGQVLALSGMLLAFAFWRRSGRFGQHAFAANWMLLVAGFVLAGNQIAGYLFV